MASPNARAALLRESSTWQVLMPTYRDAWLDACLRQTAEHCQPPEDGEVFEEVPGEKFSHKLRDRLNDYGLVAGAEFTIGKNRAGVSIELVCKHFGEDKDNNHKLKDAVVRRDNNGNVISDRKRNKDDSRSGCEVRYVASYKLKPLFQDKDDKHWIGRWLHDKNDHSGHPFPTSPMTRAICRRTR